MNEKLIEFAKYDDNIIGDLVMQTDYPIKISM
jgi:hypothetical protein